MKNKKEEFKIKTKDGQSYNVPVQGSLGLLALGYEGVKAWRKRKYLFFQERQKRRQNTTNPPPQN